MAKYRAWVSTAAKQPLVEQEIDPGPLGPEEVEIAVEYCGLCHSDKSVIEDEWAVTKFPSSPATKRSAASSPSASGPRGGRSDRRSGSAGPPKAACTAGSALGIITSATRSSRRSSDTNGGFGERMRAHWAWTIPLPEEIDMTSTGPLLCGGVTVFTPIAGYGIQPSDHVGVIGIGGLGHMGVKFGPRLGL